MKIDTRAIWAAVLIVVSLDIAVLFFEPAAMGTAKDVSFGFLLWLFAYIVLCRWSKTVRNK